MKRMSVREANQQFSKCIAEVEGGETIEITKRGTVVAVIAPKRPKRRAHPRTRADDELFWLMDNAPKLGIKKWDRDELYDRDE